GGRAILGPLAPVLRKVEVAGGRRGRAPGVAEGRGQVPLALALEAAAAGELVGRARDAGAGLGGGAVRITLGQLGRQAVGLVHLAVLPQAVDRGQAALQGVLVRLPPLLLG